MSLVWTDQHCAATMLWTIRKENVLASCSALSSLVDVYLAVNLHRPHQYAKPADLDETRFTIGLRGVREESGAFIDNRHRSMVLEQSGSICTSRCDQHHCG